jgi:hypothetical protein
LYIRSAEISWFRVEVSEFRVQGFGFRVEGLVLNLNF